MKFNLYINVAGLISSVVDGGYPTTAEVIIIDDDCKCIIMYVHTCQLCMYVCVSVYSMHYILNDSI